MGGAVRIKYIYVSINVILAEAPNNRPMVLCLTRKTGEEQSPNLNSLTL